METLPGAPSPAVLEREISIHMQLDHPNTVPLFETMQTNTEVLMVPRPCPGGRGMN